MKPLLLIIFLLTGVFVQAQKEDNTVRQIVSIRLYSVSVVDFSPAAYTPITFNAFVQPSNTTDTGCHASRSGLYIEKVITNDLQERPMQTKQEVLPYPDYVSASKRITAHSLIVYTASSR